MKQLEHITRNIRAPYLFGLGAAVGGFAAWTYGLLVGLYLVGAGVVFYAAFCRLAVINQLTWRPIRIAFVAVGAAVLLGMFGVVFWRHRPGYYELALMWSLAGLLVAASRRWRNGVPAEFDASDRVPLERAGSV